ncbi:hypothetical protein MRB53_037523 [Persea americana]|nr:hypothetical protein MRB53_037523 [Persea americana]
MTRSRRQLFRLAPDGGFDGFTASQIRRDSNAGLVECDLDMIPARLCCSNLHNFNMGLKGSHDLRDADLRVGVAQVNEMTDSIDPVIANWKRTSQHMRHQVP